MRSRGASPVSGDQAAQLRALVHGQSSAPCTVAVTSGKGGVGKTSLSVNLSICLAARRMEVVLLDADFGLANADVMLNLAAGANLSHVLSGRCELEDIMIPAPGGFRMVPAASGLTQMADMSTFERHRLLDLLSTIEHQSDVLILDCGAGISRNVITFAGSADICLVLTTPEPTSITDAYATIKVVSQDCPDARIGLVVNQCGSRGEAEETYQRVAGVAGRFLGFTVEDFGYILSDECVGLAVRQRMPLMLRYPRSSAAACISAIANRLGRVLCCGQGPRGFLRRVASMFF